MKRFLILFSFLTLIVTAQEYIFLDFFGIEDSAGNTHLVYRKHFTNRDRSFCKLNIETNEEVMLAQDLQQPIITAYIGENVTDLKFYPSSTESYLFCGQSISEYEVGGYIADADSMIFGSFWQIPYKVFISHQNTNDIFVSTIYGEYFFSNDGGNSWSVDPNYPAESDSVVNFSLISLSPFNSNVMFGVEDFNLVKSIDRGVTYGVVENLGWDYEGTKLFYDIDGMHIYAFSKFYNEYEIRISGNKGELNSWSNSISSQNEIIFCIDDSTSGEIYYSTKEKIYQSKNYGNSFNTVNELEYKVTGLYKKPKSNLLYISTYSKIYELNLLTNELKVIRTTEGFNPTVYYPLAIGNKWVYHTRGYSWHGGIPDYFTYDYIVEVIGDTVLDNGLRYFMLTGFAPDHIFERYSEDSTKVWIYSEDESANANKEFLSYDLCTQVGDTTQAVFSELDSEAFLPKIHSEDSVTSKVFNKISKKKLFEAIHTANGYYYRLAENFGVVNRESYWDFGESITNLQGCVINGIVYGDTSIIVSVKGEEENLPNKLSLSQNYPNPFNPSTKIKFTIPQDVKRETQNVKLIVYDVLGREVKTLINKPMKSGEYEVTFDGTNLPSGIYFYRLNAGKFNETRKMLLIK